MRANAVCACACCVSNLWISPNQRPASQLFCCQADGSPHLSCSSVPKSVGMSLCCRCRRYSSISSLQHRDRRGGRTRFQVQPRLAQRHQEWGSDRGARQQRSTVVRSSSQQCCSCCATWRSLGTKKLVPAAAGLAAVFRAATVLKHELQLTPLGVLRVEQRRAADGVLVQRPPHLHMCPAPRSVGEAAEGA